MNEATSQTYYKTIMDGSWALPVWQTSSSASGPWYAAASLPGTNDIVSISHAVTYPSEPVTVAELNMESGGYLVSTQNITVLSTLNFHSGLIQFDNTLARLTIGSSTEAGQTGTLTWTGGGVIGTSGVRIKRFYSNEWNVGVNDDRTLFPVTTGLNKILLWVGGNFTIGGTVEILYLFSTTNSTVSITENSVTYVNRMDASWNISYSSLSGGTNIAIRLQQSGITGVNDPNDLNLTLATSAAGGLRNTPTQSGSDYILSRSSLAMSDLSDITYHVSSTASSPLPVELASFTAVGEKGIVILRWTTAGEINNAGFDIQKKNSATHEWEVIGFVGGNGTTNVPQAYLFTDKTAVGKNVYRLKQVDNDGKYKYSGEAEISIDCKPGVFTLEQNFPNPFNPVTLLTFTLPAADFVSLMVFDAIGRKTATLVNEFKSAGTHSVVFDASLLPSGIYYARLQCGNNPQYRKMMLIR